MHTHAHTHAQTAPICHIYGINISHVWFIYQLFFSFKCQLKCNYRLYWDITFKSGIDNKSTFSQVLLYKCLKGGSQMSKSGMYLIPM